MHKGGSHLYTNFKGPTLTHIAYWWPSLFYFLSSFVAFPNYFSFPNKNILVLWYILLFILTEIIELTKGRGNKFFKKFWLPYISYLCFSQEHFLDPPNVHMCCASCICLYIASLYFLMHYNIFFLFSRDGSWSPKKTDLITLVSRKSSPLKPLF